MHIFEKNIKNLELIIPSMALPVANYVPYKIFDKILYISGQAPIKEGSLIYKGKVGKDITEEEGIEAAKLCCINIISALKLNLIYFISGIIIFYLAFSGARKKGTLINVGE